MVYTPSFEYLNTRNQSRCFRQTSFLKAGLYCITYVSSFFFRTAICPRHVLVFLATNSFVYLSSQASSNQTSDVDMAAFPFLDLPKVYSVSPTVPFPFDPGAAMPTFARVRFTRNGGAMNYPKWNGLTDGWNRLGASQSLFRLIRTKSDCLPKSTVEAISMVEACARRSR